MTQEFMTWPEFSWTSSEIDWEKAQSVTAGIDIGTTSSEAFIFCGDQPFGYSCIRTGADIGKAAERVLRLAAGSSGLTKSGISHLCSTGWGGKKVSGADRYADEIQCHARGARFIYGPSVHTVLDMGGQTVKAIRLYDWDRVRDIMVGDKCATGMGRNIEIMADLMQIPIEEMGERSFDIEKEPEPVSTTCYAFQTAETFNLLRPEFKGDDYTANEVLASYLFSIAWRVLGVVCKLSPLDQGDLSVYKDLAFTGGLAKNSGITKRIERELNITALSGAYDPMLAGAIGAALLAAETL